MNTEEIKGIIPHREPFLFVDSVQAISDATITARRLVRPNEEFFKGHFPGEPIMPGVLIVEALAQTGAILLMRRHAGQIPLFMGIDRARFRGQVRPGDTLVMTAEVLQQRGTVFRFRGAARVDDVVVCEAIMLAGMKPA